MGYPTDAPDYPYYRMAAISSHTMVKKCGVGEDMREIMYGDLSWYKSLASVAAFTGYQGGNYYKATSGYQGRAVLSHYAYRNMPGTMNTAYEFYADIRSRPDFVPHDGRIQIAYTKPGRIDTVAGFGGGPVFKTQKQLGGRAIVADSFGRSMNCPELMPGDGHYGHRDGYNALYGDWHAKWYGDPQERYTWWSLAPGYEPHSHVYYSGTYGMAFNSISDVRVVEKNPATGAPYRGDSNTQGAVYAWHLLDTDAGVDVDAEY